MKIKFAKRESLSEVTKDVLSFYGGRVEPKLNEEGYLKIGLVTMEKDGIEVDDTDICIDLLFYLEEKYDCESTDILDEEPKEAEKYQALFKD